jgi:hypothetical protein
LNLGCLVTGILSLAPRLVLLFLWLFAGRVSAAFEGILIPLLGFLFLPFTTLAYVLVWNAQSGVSGAAWLLVVGGLVFEPRYLRPEQVCQSSAYSNQFRGRCRIIMRISNSNWRFDTRIFEYIRKI